MYRLDTSRVGIRSNADSLAARIRAERLMISRVMHTLKNSYYVRDIDEMVTKLEQWLAEDEESQRRRISEVKARYSVRSLAFYEYGDNSLRIIYSKRWVF